MDEEKRKEQENSYEFLKETIKEKPLDKKNLAKRIGSLVASGVIIGLTAVLVFSAAVPGIIEKAEAKRRAAQIRFPSQKTEKQESDGEEEKTAGQPDADIGTASSSDASTTGITPQQYRALYNEIFAVTSQVKCAMVTVIGSQHDTEWFERPFERESSGVIIAESGQEFFVLTEYRVVENVDRIQVVFCDGSMTDARFQREDENTGFAVLKIPKVNISGSAKENIGVASLGESYNVKQGEPVLAIGSPMGYSDSVGYGIVTSTSHKVSKVDAEYGLLTTDIAGSSKGSGVILNLDGEIVGIISQSFAKEDTDNLVTGLSVSHTKELIKRLTDENMDLIYVGITGQNITPELSEKKGIPVGVFVEQVEVDSPAMQVGIQCGDVIVELNNERVETVREYQQLLKDCKAGETIKVKAMRQSTEAYVEVSFDVVLEAR